MNRFATTLAVLGLLGCGEQPSARQPVIDVSRAELRPDSTGNTEWPVYSSTEPVETFAEPDAAVVIHFTRTGPDAVLAGDTDDSGVPDFVENVAALYGEIHSTYHDGGWGFRVPPSDENVPVDNGGDGRFDAYLIDFELRADGAFRHECFGNATTCAGYMTQENDFAQYAYSSPQIGARVVSSHEYFHAVQAGYDVAQGVVLMEGTAVWATERFDPSLDDLEGFAPGYLATPERPLDQEPTGPVDPFSYGAGLFFECVGQQRGDDTIRDLWSALGDGQKWLPTLDAVLQADGGAPLRPLLRTCFDFNLYTGSRARSGYGHRRASQLGETPVATSTNSLVVARTPLFHAASRYWRVANLPQDAVLWWAPAPGAPDAGPSWLDVRTAADVAGAPTFTQVPPREVTAIGGGNVFVLASHLQLGVASVAIAICAGSPAAVDACRFPDAGTPDAGEVDAGIPDAGVEDAGAPDAGIDIPPPPPKSCGCSGAPSIAILAMLFMFRRKRAVAALTLAASVAFAQEAIRDETNAGTTEELVDAGTVEADAGEIAQVDEFFDAGVSIIDAGTPSPVITTPEETDSLQSRATVVTASRLPQEKKDSVVSTEVITRKQIRESGARDLTEALQAHPGIEALPNVGNVGLRMQGLGPEYNVILLDGQRINGRINGGVDISRISVENIEQIEIVKGPSSVLWGSDALAGTVNIITRKARKPLGGEATVTYGMLNQFDARAAGEASGDKWGVSMNAGYRHRDAYDLDKNDPATNGSSLDQVQASLAANYGTRDSKSPTANARVDFTRRSQAGVDSNAAGAIIDRRSRDNIVEAQLGGRIPVARGGLNLNASTSIFDRRYVLDQRNSSALDDVQDTLDVNAQLDAQFDQQFHRMSTAVVGGQFLYERLSTPRLNAPYGQRFRGAIFVQDAFTPVEQFSAIGGVRLDLDSGFGAAVTPRIAVKAVPHSTLTLRGSAGLGFRAPSFQELLLNFENPSVGYVVVGNPALKPEHSFGAHVGLEWAPSQRWLFTLDGFWNELWSMIGYSSTTVNEVLRFQYVNIARARTRGIEAVVGVMPVIGLTLQAGYTLTDARNLTENIPLEGQSVHRWFGQVRFAWRPWGVTAQVRTSVTGPRPFQTDTGTRWSPFFAQLDARVAKEFLGHFEVFVAGSNLAGAGNSTDLPIMPRSVFGGVTVHD